MRCFTQRPKSLKTRQMKTADWYFDFISPYAYLQSTRLHELSGHARIRPKPILFAGLLNHFGQLGPAEIEPKRQFIFRQALWLAKRQGIELKLPPEHPFNPLPPLRLALAMNCEIDAIQTIFNFIWRDGRNTGDAQQWKLLAEATGLTSADEMLADPAIKNALRSNTDEAITRGVFGVPSLIVDDELFWGHDAADFLLEYLDKPDALRRDVFEPVNKLAQGAARRKQAA
jgi:2-hydroxychromene-2-carboxylate isomerase